MKHHITLLFLLFSFAAGAKEVNTRLTEKKMTVSFVDTTYLAAFDLTLHYNDTAKYPYLLMMKSEGLFEGVESESEANQETKESISELNSIRLQDPLSMKSLEAEFNKKTAAKGFTKGISQTSLMEMYIFLFTKGENTRDDKPLSGTLELAKAVKILNDDDNLPLQASLVDSIKSVESMLEIRIKQNRTDHELMSKQITSLNAKSKTEKDSLTKIEVVADMELSKKKITSLDSAWNKLKTEKNIVSNAKATNDIHNIKSVDMQFQGGFLENIKVEVDCNPKVTFVNSFAIGFSALDNYKRIGQIKLYPNKNNTQFKYGYIYLGDVLRNYDNVLDINTRDYSPADTAINDINPDSMPLVKLYKSSTANLFDFRFFTDLQGLSSSQPNGLVQMEASRRFNLKSYRKPLSPSVNIGSFNYVNIYGSLNKVEKNNRDLKLYNRGITANGVLTSPYYATMMDLLQYRSFILGVETNLFLLDVPTAKFTISIDGGFQYGFTPISDSFHRVDAYRRYDTALGKHGLSASANLLTLYPKLNIEVFSESRVSFVLSYYPLYTNLFSNNNFKAIASYAKSDLNSIPTESSAKWAYCGEFFLRAYIVKNNENSRVFFRGRFFWQQGDTNTYFPQIQLGFSQQINFKKIF